MSKRITLTINIITELQNFVNLASACTGQIWVSQGRTVINASSLMGMFSIDPASPFEVEFSQDSVTEEFIDFCIKHTVI